MKRVVSFESGEILQKGERIDDAVKKVLSTVKSRNLIYNQKLRILAKIAEDLAPYPDLSKETLKLLNMNVIHDLDEGHAPYRPRYILPNYNLLLEKGSKFLEIKPPNTIYEAIESLISMYANVPSITSYPVYLGVIDEFFSPFADSVSKSELVNLLSMFWGIIDRMLPDAFVHANLSVNDNKISRAILKIEREKRQVVPNVSLKVDPDVTPKDLVLEAIGNALELSKPYLVNDRLVSKDWKMGYGVASCYNILPLAGGSFTLVRLNLLKLAQLYDGDIDLMIDDGVSKAVEAIADLVKARVNFLVEESGYFETSYLVSEGFISENNFTAMFGIFAMAETLNYIAEKNGIDGEYGYSEELNKLALRIIKKLYRETHKHTISYLKASDGRMVLHSQAGISSDFETPGIRVKYGREPHPYEYVNLLAEMHKYIKSGTSEIFVFNQTAKYNPEAVFDIVTGSFGKGMKFFSITSTFSEFIRVTGYLIKKEDLEKFEKGKAARHDTAYLGAEAVLNQRVLKRKSLSIDCCHED